MYSLHRVTDFLPIDSFHSIHTLYPRSTTQQILYLNINDYIFSCFYYNLVKLEPAINFVL